MKGCLENAVYRLQIPTLVSEIFKFEKCVKKGNEMTDDVTYFDRKAATFVIVAPSIN